MWFHTHLETDPRGTPTQHKRIITITTVEPSKRGLEMSLLLPSSRSLPAVPVSLPQAFAAHVRVPGVSAQSPASCIRSDQRFVPRGRVSTARIGSLTSHNACGSGMASLGELG